MIKTLSNELLNSLKQPTRYEKRYRVYDSLVSSFFALIAPRTISFYVTLSKSDGKRKIKNVGRYPLISADLARFMAIEAITGAKLTTSKPLIFEPSLSNADTNASGETLRQLLTRYTTSRQLAEKTRSDMVRQIERGLLDWLDRPADALTADKFEGVYRSMLERGIESSARLLARYVRAVYRWAELSDPTEKLTQKTGHSANKVESRDRRLEPHQLPDFKRIMPKLTDEQQLSIMVALVCGFRKSELQSVSYSSLCHQTQSINLARTKNGKAHNLPIPERLWRQLIKDSDIRQPDAALLHIGSHLPKAFTRLIPLSWHDLRRTTASTLHALGHSEGLIKAVLNHSTAGNVTQAHYLRFDREQIRQALSMLYDYFDY